MAKYLVDSDVLIWVLRDREESVKLLYRLSEETGETLACSSLSILEIWSGVKPAEVHKTSLFLDALESIPLDAAIARHAAELIRASRRRRDPREWVDACIAATALRFHRVLVTYNQKDYPYPGLLLYPPLKP